MILQVQDPETDSPSSLALWARQQSPQPPPFPCNAHTPYRSVSNSSGKRQIQGLPQLQPMAGVARPTIPGEGQALRKGGGQRGWGTQRWKGAQGSKEHRTCLLRVPLRPHLSHIFNPPALLCLGTEPRVFSE
jgi:hypothetical protein